MPVEDARFQADNGLRGFSAYAQFYEGATDVTRLDGPFRGEVGVMRVPRMVVYDRRISGVRHIRDTRRSRRDGFDHITLHLLVAGDLVGGPLGEERRMTPGSVMVVDTARAYLTQMVDARVCSVQLARAHVREVLPDIDRAHGLVLPEASAGLLGDYLLSFMRRASGLSARAADRAAETAVELLGVAMSDVTTSTSQDAKDELRRARAEAFIADRLADPGLDANVIAVGIGASRSALYRAFEVEGGVARHVQKRRLEGMRKALIRGRDDRSIAGLAHAHGFTSESHCSRAFAAAFGKPPKRYREDVWRNEPSKAPDDPAAKIIRWASELY